MKSPGGKRGYILMEVMLAAGIFALAGVGLVVALNEIAKTYVQASKLSLIRTELASRLNEARITPVTPGKEDAKQNSQGVRFEKEVAPLELSRTVQVGGLTSSQRMNGYYRITINASWMDGKNPQREKAEVYVYQP